MLFEGKIHKKNKNEKHMTVDVKDLDIMTQAKSLKDAHKMIKNALEELFYEFKVSVNIIPVSDTKFFVGTDNLLPFIARFLRVQRTNANLSLQDMANRLGYSSRSTYAQYEQAKCLPSLEKLSEFLKAFDEKNDFVLIRKSIA